jgi:uncharacterized small protein (DUF1192 family)
MSDQDQADKDAEDLSLSTRVLISRLRNHIGDGKLFQDVAAKLRERDERIKKWREWHDKVADRLDAMDIDLDSARDVGEQRRVEIELLRKDSDSFRERYIGKCGVIDQLRAEIERLKQQLAESDQDKSDLTNARIKVYDTEIGRLKAESAARYMTGLRVAWDIAATWKGDDSHLRVNQQIARAIYLCMEIAEIDKAKGERT